MISSSIHLDRVYIICLESCAEFMLLSSMSVPSCKRVDLRTASLFLISKKKPQNLAEFIPLIMCHQLNHKLSNTIKINQTIFASVTMTRNYVQLNSIPGLITRQRQLFYPLLIDTTIVSPINLSNHALLIKTTFRHILPFSSIVVRGHCLLRVNMSLFAKKPLFSA